MKNTEKSYIYSPVKQTKLYCYENLLNFFIEAFNKDLLPSKILLSGKSKNYNKSKLNLYQI